MGHYVTTEKGKTLYLHDSPGDQGTIIAVHGLTGNHHQFKYFQRVFSEKYRFISYDICGRGNSDPATAETSIYTHAEDLIDLIRTLKIENPILLGYSMGAYITAIAASRLSNVAGLLLLDGAGKADETTWDLVLPSLNRLKRTYSSKEEYVDETRKLYTNLNIEWTDKLEEIASYEIKQEGNGWKHKSNPALVEQDFKSFYSFRPEETLPSITCDTYLLISTGQLGEKRSLFVESSYTKTRNLLQTVQTEYTPVNHYELVFNEQPEIIQQIFEFLSYKGVRM